MKPDRPRGPARRRARRTVGIGVALLLLATVGALIDRGVTGSPRRTPSLDSLVVGAPAGFRVVSDTALTASDVSDDFQDPASEATILRQDGYQQGVHHIYRTAQPLHQYDVNLWQFRDDVAAAEFYNAFQSGNQPGSTVAQLVPAGNVPTGFVLLLAKVYDDNGDPVAIGYAVRGRIMINIVYVVDGTVTPAAVTNLLAAQFARLPAS